MPVKEKNLLSGIFEVYSHNLEIVFHMPKNSAQEDTTLDNEENENENETRREKIEIRKVQ